jgi:hypothetical protein
LDHEHEHPSRWAAIMSIAAKSLTQKLYIMDVGFGSLMRLSMTHIIASLAKPSAITANAS